jgi:hypothetical protein
MDGDGNPILDPMTQQPQPIIDPATGEPVIEPDFVVSDDTYRWEWVDAKCMLLPDAGPYMRKWNWIGEEVTVPLDEAKADERFPAELRMQFKSNVKEDKRYAESSHQKAPDSDDDEYCQLFRYCELYDIRKKRWLCLAEDQDFDEALIDDALPEGGGRPSLCHIAWMDTYIGSRPKSLASPSCLSLARHSRRVQHQP